MGGQSERRVGVIRTNNAGHADEGDARREPPFVTWAFTIQPRLQGKMPRAIDHDRRGRENGFMRLDAAPKSRHRGARRQLVAIAV